MWRPPVLLAPILPAADDPQVMAVLAGLCAATAAPGVRLTIGLMPAGPTSSYQFGISGGTPRSVLRVGLGSDFEATVELGGDRVSQPPDADSIGRLTPLLTAALLAVIERSNTAYQVEVLSRILGAATDAALLVDLRGEILWANDLGDEVLALHTLHPLALLDGAERAAPLLHVVVDQMALAHKSGERSRRQFVSTADGGRWRLEIVAVPGLGTTGCCLVILSPVRLPTPRDLASRFSSEQVSQREAEVLAQVLRGLKVAQIASQMDLSEYTVKDHLKHAYAKLGITSRGQLLSRIASSTPLGG